MIRSETVEKTKRMLKVKVESVSISVDKLLDRFSKEAVAQPAQPAQPALPAFTLRMAVESSRLPCAFARAGWIR